MHIRPIRPPFAARRLRSRGRLIAGGGAALLAATALVLVSGTISGADDPVAQALHDGLAEVAGVSSALDDLAALPEALPLTEVDPLGAAGLALDTLLADVLAAAPASFGDVAALEAALEGLDDTYGGVAVVVGCPEADPSCATPVDAGVRPDMVVTLRVPLTATRTLSTPFALGTSIGALGGGSLDVTTTLQTSLDVAVDPAVLATDPAAASWVDGTPHVDVVAAATTDAPVTFGAAFGFTDLTVEAGPTDPPAASLADLTIDLDFVDPDGDGRITRTELSTTAIEDLVTPTVGGAVAAQLALDTTLTGAAPDATLVVADTDLSDGLTVPDVTLGALDAFDNVTPEAVLAGIGQLGSAITGVQDVGDLPLPFMDATLAEGFEVAQPLLDLLARQSVVCGTSPTTPPTGSVANLPAGTTVHCQALTPDVPDAGSVVWTITGGTAGDATSGAAADGTIGAAPTAHATFVLDGVGRPDVRVAYTVDGGQARSAEQAAATVQELARQLADLAGFDPAGLVPAYDESTQALTLQLRRDVDPAAFDAGYDFADQLEAASGIVGLRAVGTAGVAVDVGEASIDVGFGMVLVEDVAEITPADNDDPAQPPGELDRFFVQVDPAGSELALADATFTAALPTLEGRLGFLGVTAEATDFTVASTGTPLLAMEVDAPGLPVGATTIPDAIRLRELLFTLADRVEVSAASLSMSGALTVSAEADGSAPLGTGSVAITWPDVTQGLPQVTVDAAFSDQLRSFDLSPNVFGTHDGPDSSPALLDASTDFTTIADAVGARLVNITDGSRCDVTAAAAGTLTCTLAGGDENDWDVGDTYRLEVGDPLALFRLVLDNLDAIAAAIDGATGGAASEFLQADLPLVGSSPDALLDQFRELGRATEELRGADAAQLSCGTADAQPPTGDPTILTAPTTVFCSATTTRAATEVQWSIEGAGTGVAAGETAVETVGPAPTQRAAFTVPAGAIASDDNPGGYRVTVRFTDADGPHEAEFPSRALPSTLQDLETAIEAKLGLPADALTLGITDVDGDRSLGVMLDYGIAGTEVVPLNVDLGAGTGGLVSVGTAGTLSLGYDAQANLHLGIPLSFDSLPTVKVLPTTGVHLDATMDVTDVGLGASVGPLAVQLGTLATQAGSPGTGVLKIAAEFDLTGPAAPSSPTDWVTGASAAFTSPGTGGCGDIDTDGDGTPEGTLTGDVGCARLSIGAGTDYLGELGLDVTSLDPLAVTPYVPDDLGQQLLDALLDFDMLLQALPELLADLEQRLDGAAQGTKVPVIGGVLDAGADVVGKLNAGLVTPLIDTVGPALDALGTTPTQAEVAAEIQRLIHEAVGGGGAGLLRTLDGTAASDDPLSIRVLCGGLPCGGDAVADLDDIRVTLNLGQDAGTPAEGLAFDIGLDGLPLRVSGAVEATAGWNVLVDFGLARDLGPYLVVGGADHVGPEVRVGAEVGLGPSPASCDPDADPVAQPGITFNASPDRCLAGTLGFIGVDARDSVDDPTGLTLQTTLDLANTTGDDRIRITDLVSGNLDATPDLEFSANVDLRVRTGLRDGESAGFPSVIGVFSASWAPGVDPQIAFDQLNLDVGSFIAQYLEPTLAEIRDVTSPIKPIIDTLNAPIPVVSDLAELVGADPITFLSLMAEVSGNNLTVIQSLVAFLEFANSDLAAGGLIPLGPLTQGGSFAINPAAAETPQTPTTAASVIQPGSVQSDTGLLAKSDLGDAATAEPPSTDDALPGTFGVPGLTFPIMEDSSRIFNVLMGADETLVRYDLGTMRATAGLSYDFGPFFIGPVPVTAGISGTATLSGRLALGYDTSGLRKVLDGASGEHLLDGIFLDDLDAHGVDVPEVSLIGTVSARAGVTVFVATAGVEGGITMTFGLNLDDRPNPDGKLRIEEIFDKLDNPICLFVVEGKLEAFLNFFLEIDYFLDTEQWTWEILRVTLLDFSAGCDPPEPVLADLGGGTLTLNMGSLARREARGVSVGTTAETFTVRALGDGAYSVTAFGVYQEYGPGKPFGDGSAITTVVAHAADGNDVITLEDGATNAVPGEPIPFTAVGILNGEGDNDRLTGGSAGDTLDGGPGIDTLKGGDGPDTLTGGPDGDTIAGEGGDDPVLDGGDGADRIQGGPGGDTADGGPGNDFVNGGPGTDPDDPNAAAATHDLGDTLSGGTGRDQLEGGFGDDRLFGESDPGGDLATRCAYDGGAAEEDGDTLSGGVGDDTLIGGGGPDTAAGDAGDDDVCGNGGNDALDGDNPVAGTPNGDDYLNGGPGDDALTGRTGADVLHGGDANDALDGGPGDDDMVGGLGSDVLQGTAGRDILLGDDGTIDGSGPGGAAARPGGLAAVAGLVTTGGAGDSGVLEETCASLPDTGATADCLVGGADADVLFGEGGGDRILGDVGGDWLDGGSGNDSMRGGQDDDIAFGQAGNDQVFGDSGDDDLSGGPDQDMIRGGIGADDAEGNGGADDIFGDADSDNLIGGSSAAGVADDEVGDRGDVIHGNAGVDFIAGDNATLIRTTDVHPDDGSQVRTVALHDIGSGDATLAGPDHLFGDEGVDRIFGQGEVDTISGGADRDLIQGNADGDAITGDDGDDLIIGGSVGLDDPDGGDVISGGLGQDVVLGDNGDIAWDGTVTPGVTADAAAYGHDVISGDDGYDQLYGELGNDHVSGDAGPDWIFGDLAVITAPAAGTPPFPGGAVRNTAVLVSPDAGGADILSGGDADDHAFGGAGDDTLAGDLGDDHLEGNGGRDAIFGFNATVDDDVVQPSDVADVLAIGLGSDQDDLIGGSSAVHPGPDRADVGEHQMLGNAAHDVMIGDNGEIVRGEAAGGSAWLPDPVTGGVLRVVTLFDRDRTGAELDAVSGGDRMLGNDGNDRMYGQGGDDVVKGNAHDDAIQGNQGNDWAEGNAGEDDLIGGSSLATPDGVGDPDGDDILHGGADADVLAGDNALISRTEGDPGPPYSYVTTQLGVDRQRFIRLLDLTPPASPDLAGADRIAGGEGEDVAFGQDEGDWITGGPDDDYMEGDGDADTLGGDRSLAALGAPAFPADVSGFPDYASGEPALNGPADPDGQDDQIGGSSIEGFRDTGDVIHGDGAADVQLGDNGELIRTISDGAYTTYVEANATTVVRLARRFDVGGPAGTSGGDLLFGDPGDDVQYGQDGDDEIHGGDDDDDQYGELGDDLMFGDAGEDAMVGDRGHITNRLIDGSPGDPAEFTLEFNGPPFLSYTAFRPGTLHRAVDLLDDGDGGPVPAPGLTHGGQDRMRGGPGRDAMHGAFGDDLMNGEDGGDVLYGDDGGDALWGGRGHPTDLADRGTADEHVDHLFGGHGGDQASILTETDFLDYRPRPGEDPDSWLAMTGLDDADPSNDQHHQGVDWMYGGFDRDVMQGDLTDNGPNPGDRMIDWTGAFNLYTHCNAAYGGQNDIRALSPQMLDFLRQLAWSTGAGTSPDDVGTDGTSAYRELGLVYQADIRDNNSGRAYPGTPGHFTEIACDNS